MDSSFGPGALSDADNAALAQAKGLLRGAVTTRRGARPAAERAAADHARYQRFADFTAFAGDPATTSGNGSGPASGMTVAAYLSVPPEPATLEIVAWLNTLGATVLVPLLTDPQRPDWARYTGPDELRVGRRGIAEPTGTPLGPQALAGADLIVCPGLGGSVRGGRLGTGGGWYDRALEHADPQTPVVMLLNDDEIFEAVPMQQWDRRVDVIITPTRTVDCQH